MTVKTLYIKLENSVYNLRQNVQPLTSLSVPQAAMFIMDTKLIHGEPRTEANARD